MNNKDQNKEIQRGPFQIDVLLKTLLLGAGLFSGTIIYDLGHGFQQVAESPVENFVASGTEVLGGAIILGGLTAGASALVDFMKIRRSKK